MRFFISLLFLPFILTSCSLAPFAPSQTGTSLGAGQASAEFGSANSTYYLGAQAGISTNFDMGYIMQFGGDFSTSAITGKYSFANNKTGPALALEGGYGSSDASSFYYLGAVASLAFNESFELFINARGNKVSTDDSEIDIGDSTGAMTVNAEELTYLLGTVGFNVWATPTLGLSIYGQQAWGEDIEWNDGLAMGAGLLMKL